MLSINIRGARTQSTVHSLLNKKLNLRERRKNFSFSSILRNDPGLGARLVRATHGVELESNEISSEFEKLQLGSEKDFSPRRLFSRVIIFSGLITACAISRNKLVYRF